MNFIKNIFTPKSLKQDYITEKIKFENFKFKFALKVSNIGIWDYDATSNKTNFSEESSKILGFNSNEIKGNSEFWNDLVHPDDKEKYFADFTAHLEGKESLYQNISRVKNKNGEYRWILDKGRIFEWTEDKKAKRVIGVHVDITESKNKEEQISESVDLITRQNKKLKNFAHIATHNLKEHSANFESLMNFYDEANTQEEKDDLITHLKTVSDSLKNTIDNLKEIVSINSSKNYEASQINPKEFIDKSIDNLILEATNTNARISNKIDAKLELNYSKAYFESITQNLLTNALKYAHPSRYPEIMVGSYETADSIFLTFKDNGIGIDLNTHQDNVFGLYQTFHNNKDSEGVGLYITKNQMESVGGKITIESEINKGSTFTLEFPK